MSKMIRLASTFLLLVFFLHLLLFVSTIHTHPQILCIDKEKHALLDFKLSFVNDPLGFLSTWRIDNIDCCAWDGVECDVHTGHVISLDPGPGLKSYQLRPSLLELQHLTELDLSGNQFHMRIPNFIGSRGNLTSLDLSSAGFFCEIPPHLGNLSKLENLVLGPSDSGSFIISNNGLYSNSLQWLSGLSSIESLEFTYVNLSNAVDWASALKKLPSLSVFNCRSCSLPPPILSSTSQVNFSTSLGVLDISNNSVSSSTFSYLINGSTNLWSLRLDYMELEHHVLHEFLEALIERARYTLLLDLSLVGNNLTKLPFEGMVFPSLRTLGLSFNQISELCPQDQSALSSLTSLDLSFNRISKSRPEILQHISTNLTSLDVSSNLLSGTVISDTHFSKFFHLDELRLSDNNQLTVNFSKSWMPPFQLSTLYLRSCKVGPNFPNWILTQKSLEHLDISNSMISDVIPDAFWDLFPRSVASLNLSHNNISCMIPNSNLFSSHNTFDQLDLSYNAFDGPIPLFLFTTIKLYLSNNRFSSFSPFYHGVLSHGLSLISLSYNHLSGSLPDWLFQFDKLLVLNLENNKLSRTLPAAIGSLWQLNALHLSNNNFFGKIPLSMKNCTHLIIIELENNKFSGFVPFWLGETMTQLVALSLRSNVFSGHLPSSLRHLQSLQILDLSDNEISGIIPSCVDNLTRMATDEGSKYIFKSSPQLSVLDTNSYWAAIDDASIMWKGALITFDIQNLKQRNVINLSSNILVGEIPIGLAALKGLRSLDLSRNDLNGSIPDTIGQLTSLEVLKLSSNRLYGEIPTSLASLTFLNTLNLSNNNLSGRIPTSTQLQSFDPSSYAGNPNLYGQPLPTKCPGDESNKQPPIGNDDPHDEDDESFDIQTFLAASGAGFAFGVLGVLGMLHFNRQWRIAFFQSVDYIADKIFVATSLFQSRIKRSLCLR